MHWDALKAEQFLQPRQHQTDRQKKSSMKRKHENTVTNKAACVSFASLLQIKTCTKSKSVSRKMTHPGHLREFLQLGKDAISCQFLFWFLLASQPHPTFIFSAYISSSCHVKNFSSSSSTAAERTGPTVGCSFRVSWLGSKTCPHWTPWISQRNIPWPPSLEWQHLNNGHFNSAASGPAHIKMYDRCQCEGF